MCAHNVIMSVSCIHVRDTFAFGQMCLKRWKSKLLLQDQTSVFFLSYDFVFLADWPVNKYKCIVATLV